MNEKYFRVSAGEEIWPIVRANPNAKIYYLAGGTDLYVSYRERLLKKPYIWIDISGIGKWREIRDEGKNISIGSLVTFSRLENESLIKKWIPALAQAAGQMGAPQIRNRATIGGNISNSSPAGDSIPPLTALDASLKLRLGGKERIVKISSFFTGPKKNILDNGEVLEKILIPKHLFNIQSFEKIGSRKALSISKVSVAVAARIEKGIISDIRIACGAVGPTVLRAGKSEALLRGKKISREIIEQASQTVAGEVCPIDDFRSLAKYRCQAAGALFKRAFGEV